MPLLNPARPADWLAALYPLPVHAAELPMRADDTFSPALLSGAEWQSIRHCADSRIRDFIAGRACAHRALEAAGFPGFSLLPGPDRAPVWPPGVVGSITHTEGFSAAVVARREHARGIGVDTEVVEALKPELWKAICAPDELGWLRTLPPSWRWAAAALIFSAKEAFFKCQFPVLRLRADFSDTRLQLLAPVIENEALVRGAFQIEPPAGLCDAALAAEAWRGQFQRHGAFMTAAMAWAA